MKNKDYNKIIASQLMKYIHQKKLNINQLAKKSGIRQSTLNNIINGGNVPSIPTITSICYGLDISIIEFLDVEPFNKKSAQMDASQN
ncbi:helix-turn-helix domain-containing protein [Enterococcus dispar]|jgi:transcriptional regulator with XRE-family HTH domain|uniref:helix-turn-helix domain-containing protein n=1 Tax=Enterococcus dispar TaxID=44009 RepID=UPI00189F2924|nr:helix-turn-helix transcriptional regulator [Enterococcus dispar]